MDDDTTNLMWDLFDRGENVNMMIVEEAVCKVCKSIV